uniref:Cap-specific mRNA (nucleoside-2'-O-)-methyltransferase 1 n=1 Tax=Panagrolaimus superbus TaxID=310955 RepID=A0A914Y214_9BILA
MNGDGFNKLRQARNEDRLDGYVEEMSALNSGIPRLSSDSSDGEDETVDSRPSFGGFNQQSNHSNFNQQSNHSNTHDSPMNSRKRPAEGHTDGPDAKLSFAEQYMQSYGYEKGKGLGRNQTGIVEPIQAVGHTKRRGLGDEKAKALAIQVGAHWDESAEDKGIEEEALFVTCDSELRENFVISGSWIRVGSPKLTIDDEDRFCNAELIKDLLDSKSVFDNLTSRELNNARARANPYETIKSAIFQNRAAVKMANMDKVFGWGLSQETDETRRRAKCPIVSSEAPTNDYSRNSDLWYFADVCAGPGGFSEYLIWRKAYYNCHGYGFTLKGECDFKLEKFIAGSACYFDNYYGPKEDGNVYDPDNLIALEKKVKDETDGRGVHLVTCDGGFSVEGQENIQEILSKRLYLCQFLSGLSLCRVATETSPGGNFVCKLFDIFTPFSVGLIYLMYIAFEKISLHKPVTSRPANSERYIYCENLTEIGATVIKEHLFEVNNKLESFKNQGKEKEYDVMEVIPVDKIEEDAEFMDYLINHNETLIRKQTLYLRKYLHFAKDSGKRDRDQGKIREEALDYWEIPNIDRKAMSADENKPVQMFFNSLASKEFKINDDFQKHRKFELDKFVPKFPQELFHELYNAQILCSQLPPFLLISDYKERTFVRTVDSRGFLPMDDFPKFPRKTILLMEKVSRWSNGKKDSDVLRIVDAAVIGGDDVSKLPLKDRLKAAEKFAKAYVCRSNLSLVVATASSIIPQEFQTLINSMFSNVSAAPRSLPYTRPNEDQLHFYYPAHGIRFLRAVKDSFSKCWSRSQKSKYYFDMKRNQNHDRNEGHRFIASFWDNIAEGPQYLQWNLNHHSKTTAKDILEEQFVEDTITAPAVSQHIQQIFETFCTTYGVNFN